MNNSRLVASALVVTLILVVPLSTRAQYGGHSHGGHGGSGGEHGSGSHTGSQGTRYNPETVETDAGVITELSFMGSEKHKITTMTIKIASGSLLVELGPQDDLDAQAFKLAVGDNVLAQGSKIKVYEQMVMLAAVVTDKGDALKLRDPGTGKPLWKAERPAGDGSPTEEPVAAPK